MLFMALKKTSVDHIIHNVRMPGVRQRDPTDTNFSRNNCQLERSVDCEARRHCAVASRTSSMT
jgi:hypothetical protein